MRHPCVIWFCLSRTPGKPGNIHYYYRYYYYCHDFTSVAHVFLNFSVLICIWFYAYLNFSITPCVTSRSLSPLGIALNFPYPKCTAFLPSTRYVRLCSIKVKTCGHMRAIKERIQALYRTLAWFDIFGWHLPTMSCSCWPFSCFSANQISLSISAPGLPSTRHFLYRSLHIHFLQTPCDMLWHFRLLAIRAAPYTFKYALFSS